MVYCNHAFEIFFCVLQPPLLKGLLAVVKELLRARRIRLSDDPESAYKAEENKNSKA
jgi:hypothetical protein